MKEAYFLVLCVPVAAIAAWIDWRKGTIPNNLTLPVLGLGLLGHFAAGLHEGGTHGALLALAYSAGGAVAAALSPFVLWRMGGIGGGDVKLFAALGALAGFLGGLEIATFAFVSAALVAPSMLAYRGVLFRTLGRTLTMVANPVRRKENRAEVPRELLTWFRLGPCVLLGACLTVIRHVDAIALLGGP